MISTKTIAVSSTVFNPVEEARNYDEYASSERFDVDGTAQTIAWLLKCPPDDLQTFILEVVNVTGKNDRGLGFINFLFFIVTDYPQEDIPKRLFYDVMAASHKLLMESDPKQPFGKGTKQLLAAYIPRYLDHVFGPLRQFRSMEMDRTNRKSLLNIYERMLDQRCFDSALVIGIGMNILPAFFASLGMRVGCLDVNETYLGCISEIAIGTGSRMGVEFDIKRHHTRIQDFNNPQSSEPKIEYQIVTYIDCIGGFRPAGAKGVAEDGMPNIAMCNPDYLILDLGPEDEGIRTAIAEHFSTERLDGGDIIGALNTTVRGNEFLKITGPPAPIKSSDTCLLV